MKERITWIEIGRCYWGRATAALLGMVLYGVMAVQDVQAAIVEYSDVDGLTFDFSTFQTNIFTALSAAAAIFAILAAAVIGIVLVWKLVRKATGR
jgi:hypothetical protein